MTFIHCFTIELTYFVCKRKKQQIYFQADFIIIIAEKKNSNLEISANVSLIDSLS